MTKAQPDKYATGQQGLLEDAVRILRNKNGNNCRLARHLEKEAKAKCSNT